MTAARDVLAAARGLADDLLFPAATRVDGLDVLPLGHLDALAALGLYGAPVPAGAGGLGLDLAAYCAVTEELASVMARPRCCSQTNVVARQPLASSSTTAQ